MTIAVEVMAEMETAKHLPTDSGARKEKQEAPIFSRITKEEMEIGVEVECCKVSPISNLMGQAHIRNEKWVFGKRRKQWEFGEAVYLLDLMGQAQVSVWRKMAEQRHQFESRVGLEIVPQLRIRERQFLCPEGWPPNQTSNKNEQGWDFTLASYSDVVIRGYPSGLAAAVKAIQLGLKTCDVAKRSNFCGYNLDVGCISSKASFGPPYVPVKTH